MRLVEDQAEAGASDEAPSMPSLMSGRLAHMRLPDRIALGIGEALDVGAVRHRGQQMARDLRLLVVRHLDAGGRAQRRGAAPLGDAAAFGGVEVDDVHRAGVEQAAHAVAGDLGLARR